MEKWKGKVAVVTGASAGIGEAISEELVKYGLKVVGLARRTKQIDDLAKTLGDKSGKLYSFPTDVTKEEDILKAFEWIKSNVGSIHILINNAGISRRSTLIDGNTKFWKEVIDTNVLGLCIATREAIKDMRANSVDGHIIHMNSVGGHCVPNIRGTNVYTASKHAVTALTETLRQELTAIGSKIKISSVSPGYVNTEIFEATSRACGLTRIPEKALESLKKTPMLQSRDVADAILYILATPPHVQVHEMIIKPVGELV